MLRNFAWASASQYVTFVIRFVGGIYLARQIDPFVFGQQGLALTLAALFWSFALVGEQTAILRLKDNVTEYSRMVLFVRVVIVVGLSLAFSIFYFLGWLPGSAQVRLLALVFFLCQIPMQITSIYQIHMTKQMLFRRIAGTNIVSSLCGMSAACVLAFCGYAVQALVALVAVEFLCVALLTLVLVPKRYTPKFDKLLALDFFHFSKYVFPLTQLNRLQDRMPALSIGTLVGLAPLSFYDKACGFAGMFQMLIMGGLIDYVQPHLANIQDDRAKLGRHFEFVSCILIRAAVATFCCLALVLPFLVEAMYGKKWLEIVPVFRFLLPFAVLSTYKTFLRYTHQVVGSVRYLTYAQIGEFAALAGLMYPLVKYKGILGSACALNASVVVSVFMMLWYLKSYAGFSVRRVFLNPLASTAGAMGIVWITGWAGGTMNALSAALTASTFSITYMLLLLVLERKFVLEAVAWFWRALKPSSTVAET